MPFQEVVEAEGHLIDSHIMENIFDKVVEYHGRFEVQEFRIGRTNVEGSYLRMLVETPDASSLARLLESLLELGCAPIDSGDAELRTVDRDRCAPEDFYSTTNHRTHVRIGERWIESENQRMDAMIVVHEGRASCRRLRDLRQGDPSSSACAASASRRNRRSATASRSPSCPTASPPNARWKRPSDRPRRWSGRPSNRNSRSSWWPGRWWFTPAAWRDWRR